jgi:1-acyl-sn-glycerol-3-phosphate acyltransferase
MPDNQRTHWVNYFGRGLIRFLIFLFAFWKVKGRENIPREGPLLIVSNHIFIADPPMLAASIPRKSVFMAKEDLWHDPWSRFWVENFCAFPVKRGVVDRAAIRQAEYWLGQGRVVIMFPEGGRSKNAQLMAGLPGAALIASHAGIPILPVGIAGSEKLKKLGWAFFHHPTITITIGKPFNLPPATGKSAREQRQQMTDYIMRKIAEILPPEYRGVYAAAKNTDN